MTRIVELRQGVLKKNDELARALRTRLRAAGVFTVNLVSSPGSGKTELLRETLSALRARGHRVAALVGDLATDNDARRLAESGAPVRQITTAGLCHLDAQMVEAHLDGWLDPAPEYLFVENVGNLVCPAGYDLGEDLRAVLISVTEGEDKPRKYPTIFNSADVVVVTKMDLAVAVGFDRARLMANLEAVRPGVRLVETACRGEPLMGEWLHVLDQQRLARRRVPSSPGARPGEDGSAAGVAIVEPSVTD